MKKIEILGTGCKKCLNTAAQFETVAKGLGVEVDVIIITNPEVTERYKIRTTPAVIIDGKVVHSGSVPDRQTAETLIQKAPVTPVQKAT